MKTSVLALCALGAALTATPASATVEVTSGSTIGCSTAPLSPGADKCAGYFSGNQFSNSNVSSQQAAIDLLLGPGQYTVDWNALQAAGRVVSGSDMAALNNLLANAGGQVLLGIHWGNVPESGNVPYGNVSAIYLWNNVPAGAITLTNMQGYSNAVLYRAAPAMTAVPEPGTWAMMLLGFAGIGGALRRRRAAPMLQIA